MADITLMGPRTLSILQAGITQEHRDQMVDEVCRLVGPLDYKTNVKANMTSYFLHQESTVFDIFIKRLLDLTKESNWLYKLHHLTPAKFYLRNFWGAIYSKGDYTIRHTHLPFIYSFVYFLRVGASDTPLVFDELNYSYTPIEDEIIFFPADILHHVPRHMYDEDRIVLAGNVAAAGLGDVLDLANGEVLRYE